MDSVVFPAMRTILMELAGSIRAAATADTPATRTNVWTQPEYRYYMCRASYGEPTSLETTTV